MHLVRRACLIAMNKNRFTLKTKQTSDDKKLFQRAILLGGLTVAAAAGYKFARAVDEQFIHLPKAVAGELLSFSSTTAGSLAYYVDQQQSGQPLLLLHSINAAASSFEMKPLFEYFGGRRPVYSLELPGFGFAERSAHRAYVPELYAQSIVEMISSQIGAQVDVVALSLSSEFAARAALNRPDLFRSLTLISPTGFSGQMREFPGEWLYRFFSLPLLSQALFALLTRQDVIRYYLQQSFVGEVPASFIKYAYAASHQPGARYAPLYFLSTQMFTPDALTSLYDRLTLPVTVLYDQDPNVSFAALPDFVAERPNWQAIRVQPSLGLPHWEQLDEVVSILDQVLAQT